jgi:hypothetical protein
VGKLKLKVAPLSRRLFSAHILPPWASIMLLQMNNPKPVPPTSDFVTNFENNLGKTSG